MSLCVSHTHRLAKVDFSRVGEFATEVVGPEESSFQVMGVTRDIQVKIATEQAEFEEAFALVAANYRARGYESPGDKPYRFTPYHALPTTVTLVAKHEGKVVATLSLVPDTEFLGLPMESIFGEEIAGLRQEGRKMAEAISLADSGLSIREFVQVFKAMIRLGMQYHASRGGDTFVITVNPRHRSFYQKVLGFESLGPRRILPDGPGPPRRSVSARHRVDEAKRPPDVSGSLRGVTRRVDPDGGSMVGRARALLRPPVDPDRGRGARGSPRRDRAVRGHLPLVRGRPRGRPFPWSSPPAWRHPHAHLRHWTSNLFYNEVATSSSIGLSFY